MPWRSDSTPEDLRRQVLGLGQDSVRKSHYPSLRQRLSELERFRFMVDISGDMLFVLNAETVRITDVNGTGCREIGVPRAALLDQCLGDFIDPSDGEKLRSLLDQLSSNGGGSASLISSMRGASRQYFPVEMTVALGVTGGQEVAVVAARNVTKRMADEIALRRSEERYRLLVEQMEDGLFVADAQGCYLDVNRAGCEMLGYQRDEIIGRSIADVIDSAEIPRIGPEIARLANSEVVRSEWRFQRKDGSIFIGEVLGRQFADGRLQAVLRDISERRRIEERLRQSEEQSRIALDAAKLGAWRHEIATGTLWHDERAQRILGVPAESSPAAFFGRIHPDDSARMNEVMTTMRDPTRSSGRSAEEFRIVDAFGDVRWLHSHAYAQFENEGEGRYVKQVIGTIEDISARKQIELKLARISRAYETQSAINKCIVHAVSERDVLASACRVAVESGGFQLVRVDCLGGRPSIPEGLPYFGPAAAILERPELADREASGRRRNYLQALLRSGGDYCSDSAEIDPFLPHHAMVYAEFGIRSFAVFPLRVEGRDLHAIFFYAGSSDYFDADMMRMLREMTDDIAFGWEKLIEARKLWQTELRFAKVFRASPSAILITRAVDAYVADANDAFLKLFAGGQRAGIVGSDSFEHALWHQPAERDMLLGLIAQSGGVKDFEARWRGCSGEAIDCLISVETVTLGGGKHLLWIVTDITERLAAARLLHTREQEFRALVENSPDLIIRYDREGRRLYANPAVTQRLGVSLEDILGKTPVESWPDRPISSRVQAVVAEVVANGLPVEMEHETTDGPLPRPEYHHIRFAPEFDANGQVSSVLTVARDIGKVKETEQRLLEIQVQLRELSARREAVREDERKHMAREIHDVLGQLLTALRLDIDMLGMEFGAEQPMLIERTAKTTELVDSTIAIVRNLASALRPSALDMGIVSALEWQAKEFSGRTGMVCDVVVDESDVALDEVQAISVFRVVQESLTNVVRHSAARRVEIALCKVDDEYWLSIQDDGVGFDAGVSSRKTLGLLGMRERVSGLGGELFIDSALGQGTRIDVRFPFQRVGDGS